MISLCIHNFMNFIETSLMFAVEKIRLKKKISNTNELSLLFDTNTSCPCMYPLLYSMKSLRFRGPSTQNADLTALQFWYDFWYVKFSTSFCESFYSSSYNLEIIQNEIDNFIVYLENNRNYNENIIQLRNNQNINYGTLARRVSSFLKFYSFLVDEYFTSYTQPQLTAIEIVKITKKIKDYIENKKKAVRSFSGVTRTVKNKKAPIFKSMDYELTLKLYSIIAPNNLNRKNELNPFKNNKTQLRNFIIVHLMINYGLRVGELMLLTTKSFKKSQGKDKFSLIITNTEDEYDNRARKPNIKNEFSYRVIELEKRDYNILNIYKENIRNNISSEILFTSLKPPYSPLSYASINKILEELSDKLKSIAPEYFDVQNHYSIENLTPHTCRHTWAYMMLNDAYANYSEIDKYTKKEALLLAQEDLRTLGGWAPDSPMPMYYGKRFHVERANSMNLARIRKFSFDL